MHNAGRFTTLNQASYDGPLPHCDARFATTRCLAVMWRLSASSCYPRNKLSMLHRSKRGVRRADHAVRAVMLKELTS
jgi:hypothetical protein